MWKSVRKTLSELFELEEGFTMSRNLSRNFNDSHLRYFIYFLLFRSYEKLLSVERKRRKEEKTSLHASRFSLHASCPFSLRSKTTLFIRSASA